jgi:zinc protease
MRSSCYLAFFAATVCLAAENPSGASLIDRYIERTGGTAAYAKIRNMAMSGAVQMAAQNISGTVTIFQEGEKTYTSMDFAGIGKIEEGYDGVNAWQNSALQGPRVLEGDEKLSAERGATLGLITNWREVYKEANTIGPENVDGKPAWKVEMVAREGKPETFYFNRESGLLVRTSAVYSTPMGEIKTESSLSDYRPVNGILTPFTMTENAMNANIAMHFNTITYNATIPNERFEPPAAVKELLSKKK